MAILLYDGACGFCRVVAAVLMLLDRRYQMLPLSIDSPEGAALLADMPEEVRHRSFHVVTATGRRSEGGALAALAQAFVAPQAAVEQGPRQTTERAYQPLFVVLHGIRPHLGPRMPARLSHRWAKAALARHQRRARQRPEIQAIMRAQAREAQG